MKQAKLLALMISLIIICGCSKSEKYEEQFTTWRNGCISTANHEIKAEVSATDKDKVCDYTILYNSSLDGETVKVLAPELITQIGAEIKEGETRLTYDGAVLDTGSALTGRLSPLMALPTFMSVIKDGHAGNSWNEESNGTEMLVTELEMPDGMIMTLWQNSGDFTPVHAELRSDNTVEVKINITQFK